MAQPAGFFRHFSHNIRLIELLKVICMLPKISKIYSYHSFLKLSFENWYFQATFDLNGSGALSLCQKSSIFRRIFGNFL